MLQTRRAQQNGIDAAYKQIAHVVALLGHVDIAVENDQLDVRVTAGFGLKRSCAWRRARGG